MPRTPIAPRVGSVLLLDATGEKLWAGLATPSGVVRVYRTAAAPTGRSRAVGFIRLVQQVLQLVPGRLAGVAAVVGPATPGGVRLAVTTANALAWALKLPISSYQMGERVIFGPWRLAGSLRPRYIHGPNITKPR